jgi:hypothetical protein
MHHSEVGAIKAAGFEDDSKTVMGKFDRMVGCFEGR